MLGLFEVGLYLGGNFCREDFLVYNIRDVNCFLTIVRFGQYI